VKPDATPEEVAAVTEGGGQQIFAQAVGGYPYKICYISD
jgi:t-SNARE complex subunit (syntaxin)